MIKLYKGDCLIESDKIESGSVDLILTDPPYKATSRGSSGGTGGIFKDNLNKKGMVFKHNSITFDEWLPECFRVLKNDSHAYFMCNNKNLSSMLISIDKAGFKIFKTLIWAKNSPITNMYYMDSHEYIIFCRKGKAKRINNCGTKSVLNIDNPRNKIHPTQKPIELMEILIKNSTNENNLVFDPFMGSGSTMVACKNTNRNGIGIEMDDEYFSIAKKRLSL